MAALEADVREAEVANDEAVADLEKARLEVSVFTAVSQYHQQRGEALQKAMRGLR